MRQFGFSDLIICCLDGFANHSLCLHTPYHQLVVLCKSTKKSWRRKMPREPCFRLGRTYDAAMPSLWTQWGAKPGAAGAYDLLPLSPGIPITGGFSYSNLPLLSRRVPRRGDLGVIGQGARPSLRTRAAAADQVRGRRSLQLHLSTPPGAETWAFAGLLVAPVRRLREAQCPLGRAADAPRARSTCSAGGA